MKHDKEGVTILIVDDNLAIRTISKTFLENAGYTVITATDGEEGLRFFLQRQSSISLDPRGTAAHRTSQPETRLLC